MVKKNASDMPDRKSTSRVEALKAAKRVNKELEKSKQQELSYDSVPKKKRTQLFRAGVLDFQTQTETAHLALDNSSASKDKAHTIPGSSDFPGENISELMNVSSNQDNVEVNKPFLDGSSHSESDLSSRNEDEIVCILQGLKELGDVDNPAAEPISDCCTGGPELDSYMQPGLISPADKYTEPPQAESKSRYSKVIVYGKDITSNIEPLDVRTAYFNLCSALNSELHARLVEGIDIKDVVNVITQTATISKEIENCNPNTPEGQMSYWAIMLGSFAQLGMNVDFMVGRVKRLLQLKKNEGNFIDNNRLEEAKFEGKSIDKNIKNIEMENEKMMETIKSNEFEILKMKNEKGKVDEEICHIKGKIQEFIQEATAPW